MLLQEAVNSGEQCGTNYHDMMTSMFVPVHACVCAGAKADACNTRMRLHMSYLADQTMFLVASLSQQAERLRREGSALARLVRHALSCILVPISSLRLSDAYLCRDFRVKDCKLLGLPCRSSEFQFRAI